MLISYSTRMVQLFTACISNVFHPEAQARDRERIKGTVI